ncbi:MAG: IclR family transcriptional regulator [Candidatus Sumerlaeia bacterium]
MPPSLSPDVPRSLERGLSLLEILGKSPQGMRYTDLVEAMALPNTTVTRLLQSLETLGYIAKNDEGLYAPGKRMQGLGLEESLEDRLLRVGTEPMRELAHYSHNSAALLMWTGRDAVFLARELYDGSLVYQNPGYVIAYIYNTPWGIFFLNEAEWEGIFRTNKTVLEDARFAPWYKRERRRFEREGYCTSAFLDRRRMAAPIYAEGKIVAALALGGTPASLPAQRMKEHAPLLLQLSRACSDRMG